MEQSNAKYWTKIETKSSNCTETKILIGIIIIKSLKNHEHFELKCRMKIIIEH